MAPIDLKHGLKFPVEKLAIAKGYSVVGQQVVIPDLD